MPEQPAVLPAPGRAVGRRPLDAVLADHRRGCSRRSCGCSGSTGCSTIPKWSSVPELRRPRRSGIEYFELMLPRCGRRPTDEWQEVFDREPDVWAEIFRHGSELLDHPQMLHDHSRVTVDDPGAARCVQPGPIVQHRRRRPRQLERPAPALDAARRRAASPGVAATAASRVGATPADDSAAARGCHRDRAGDVLRRAVRRHAAHRSRRARHQGRAARRRPDPPHHAVPRGRRGRRCCRARRASRSTSTPTKGAQIVHELVRRADAVLRVASAPAWPSGSASTRRRCSRSTPTSCT